MVANGERVTCESVIYDAPLLIVGALFPVDLFVMPLVGYNVVLDTKWLDAWDPSFGTSLAGACRSNTRATPFAGRAWHRRLRRASKQPWPQTPYSTSCWAPSSTSSPSRPVYYQPVVTTTALSSSPMLPRWQCARTGTRSPTRMNSSDSALP
jgi:hypothetical protein